MDNINLHTLLEAAKFVEVQDVQAQGSCDTRDDDCGTGVPANPKTEPVATSSPHLKMTLTSSWVKATADLSHARVESGDDDQFEVRQRSGFFADADSRSRFSLVSRLREKCTLPLGWNGKTFFRNRYRPGPREVHNKLEKDRRAHLNECFELVKKQLPPISEDRNKTPNHTILHNAIKYIQMLRRKERDYELEIERLTREKIALQQRHATFEKELATQWGHIDFDTLILIPEGAVFEQKPTDRIVEGSDAEELMHHYSSRSSSSLSSAASPPQLLQKPPPRPIGYGIPMTGGAFQAHSIRWSQIDLIHKPLGKQ